MEQCVTLTPGDQNAMLTLEYILLYRFVHVRIIYVIKVMFMLFGFCVTSSVEVSVTMLLERLKQAAVGDRSL